ncbi:signal peptidase II [bacterium]|nr:MAG: signal peptidase II [bacterium]
MPTLSRKTLAFFAWLVGLFVVWIDQLSKAYVSGAFAVGETLPVIKGVLHLSLVHNTGVAFGLFRDHNTLLSILSLAVIIYIARDSLSRKKDRNLCRRVALGLILGGASGNLIDRIRLGYIVDFLDFRVWPVFNIADSAITIGIILLAIEILFQSGRVTRNVSHTS